MSEVSKQQAANAIERANPSAVSAIPSGGDIVKAAPGLAVVAATSIANLATWSFRTSVSASTFVVRRTMEGASPQSILSEASSDIRTAMRGFLGLTSSQVIESPPGSYSVSDRRSMNDSVNLQARGAALLRRAADVHADDEGHPAFARILSELAPDEARVLRFLFLDGPQPSIDIRTGRPLGIGSELIEGGLNMIGEHAGLRYAERIHPYLTNLNRLGMVEFSKEQVSNPTRYQLVEAQPHMVDLMKKAGFASKAVQRSILLTPFGEDFVRTCLPVTNRRNGSTTTSE